MSGGLLPCPGMADGSCVRSDPRIIKQTDTFCTFQCYTCKVVYVETFPRYDSSAKYENYRKRITAIEQQQKAHDRRTRYHT